LTIGVAIAALTQFLPAATAGDLICPDGDCYSIHLHPVYPVKRPHNFRPGLHDGVPVVTDFRHDPEGFFGVGCVWAWRPVPTPNGPAWSLVQDCMRY
jgi:hypothetical protein